MNSCSSEGDEDEEPAIKAQRERERRQANNARERYNKPIDKTYFIVKPCLLIQLIGELSDLHRF